MRIRKVSLIKMRREYFGSMPWVELLPENKPCEAFMMYKTSCNNPGQYMYDVLPRSEADEGVVCWAHLWRNLLAEGERERTKQWTTENPPPELLRIAKNFCE